MRLNQPQDRMPPLRAPILTKMVVSASMASVLMRCCSSHNRSTGGLLIRTTCMRLVHHMRGGADDVTGLLIAALTASARSQMQRSGGCGSGVGGAARCSEAALALMPAARLSPGWTPNAAVPTAGSNAAATSADTDENGRVCVGDLGPYALLLRATPEHQQLAALRPSHTPHAPHTRRS